MEQATIVSYAFGYLAAMFAAFLVLLPVLLPCLLLLLLGGALQLLFSGLRLIALGIYRYAVRLLHSMAGSLRSWMDRSHGSRGGRRLPMH